MAAIGYIRGTLQTTQPNIDVWTALEVRKALRRAELAGFNNTAETVTAKGEIQLQGTVLTDDCNFIEEMNERLQAFLSDLSVKALNMKGEILVFNDTGTEEPQFWKLIVMDSQVTIRTTQLIWDEDANANQLSPSPTPAEKPTPSESSIARHPLFGSIDVTKPLSHYVTYHPTYPYPEEVKDNV